MKIVLEGKWGLTCSIELGMKYATLNTHLATGPITATALELQRLADDIQDLFLDTNYRLWMDISTPSKAPGLSALGTGHSASAAPVAVMPSTGRRKRRPKGKTAATSNSPAKAKRKYTRRAGLNRDTDINTLPLSRGSGLKFAKVRRQDRGEQAVNRPQAYADEPVHSESMAEQEQRARDAGGEIGETAKLKLPRKRAPKPRPVVVEEAVEGDA